MKFSRDNLKTMCRALTWYIEDLDRQADDLRNVGLNEDASGKYEEITAAGDALDQVRAELGISET